MFRNSALFMSFALVFGRSDETRPLFLDAEATVRRAQGGAPAAEKLPPGDEDSEEKEEEESYPSESEEKNSSSA